MFPSQHFYERPYAQHDAFYDRDLERCIYMLRAAHSRCERDPYMRIPALPVPNRAPTPKNEVPTGDTLATS